MDFEEIKRVIIESRQLILAMGLNKPQLEHTSELIDSYKDIIARMARLGDVIKVQQGRGLQLLTTKNPVWMVVKEESIRSYKDTIVAQLNDHKNLQQKLAQRLDNPGYVKSAPEHVVSQTQDQLKASKAAAKQLEKELTRFTD
jgi:valyl-tRNA synthetase